MRVVHQVGRNCAGYQRNTLFVMKSISVRIATERLKFVALVAQVVTELTEPPFQLRRRTVRQEHAPTSVAASRSGSRATCESGRGGRCTSRPDANGSRGSRRRL